MRLPFNIHVTLLNKRVFFEICKVQCFSFSIGRKSGLTACLHLGKNKWLSYRISADYNEQLIWQLGPFFYTIPETEEQRLEREDAEAEAAFMDSEANRYTEWSY